VQKLHKRHMNVMRCVTIYSSRNKVSNSR